MITSEISIRSRPADQTPWRPPDAREALLCSLLDRGLAPDLVSVAIGLKRDYLREFFVGWPVTLPAWVRQRLASHLGLSEESLRGGSPL